MPHSAVPSLLSLGRRSALETMEALTLSLAKDANGAVPGSGRGTGPLCLLALDGTCGNGRDTLWLAAGLRALRQSHAAAFRWSVLALDIQERALASAGQRLAEEGLLDLVTFARQGHEELEAILGRMRAARPEPLALGLGVYNLGYLPGGDKGIRTSAPHTLRSLEAALRVLVPGGMLLVHAYAGHAGGPEELEAVRAFACGLSESEFSAASYALCNKSRNPEALFLISRRRIR
ncbi:class I SAM-dependent methyltransferase [Desulfovibrio sp. OttesenSCG-928-A18]|nr:class I SAM-dependent methyltransferase [Desulfovibrio sp. OttesenSCG-928-A18]